MGEEKAKINMSNLNIILPLETFTMCVSGINVSLLLGREDFPVFFSYLPDNPLRQVIFCHCGTLFSNQVIPYWTGNAQGWIKIL